MDDIFIDNRASHNFKNPMTPEYREFYNWLLTKGVLLLSHKIINEYNRSNNGCSKDSNILSIITDLHAKSRTKMIKNNQIEDFKNKHKRHFRNCRCNNADRFHIPVIMLSDRKLALIIDIDFCHDVNNFPGYNATAKDNPSNLNYA